MSETLFGWCSKRYPESRSAMEKSLESLDWSLAFLTWKLLVTLRTVAWVGLMFLIYIYIFIWNVHYTTCMCICNIYIYMCLYKPKYIDRYFLFTYHFKIPKFENSFTNTYTMLLLMAGIQLRVAISSGGNSPQWPPSLGQCWDPHRFSKMTCFISPFKKDSKRSPANTWTKDSEVRASLSPRLARYKPSPQSWPEVCGGWEGNKRWIQRFVNLCQKASANKSHQPNGSTI